MYDFQYHSPDTLEAAERVLAGGAANKLMAGGMSLLPTLKHRLARHDAVIDLRRVASLCGIRRESGTLVIGAMTPHAVVAGSADVAAAIPALGVLAGGIGDPLVRNRGTIGGSLANCDPAADYPAGVLGLGATIETHRRRIAADDFFRGLFETALEPAEIITAVHFPIPRQAGYAKFRQPASRFALAGVMVARTADGVRVAVTGARAHAFRWTEAEERLAQRFEPAALAGLALAADGLNADIHASAEYRAQCVAVMTRRAVEAACTGAAR